MPAIFATPRRLSALSLAIACALPTVAFADASTVSHAEPQPAADDTMTVVATGNPRNSFSAPMMVTVIDGASPQ
ncbi:TonB-dependent receptor, partial [Serratia rubidaea]|nr:TonB-dependent receptor [Serratia rubidaea]